MLEVLSRSCHSEDVRQEEHMTGIGDEGANTHSKSKYDLGVSLTALTQDRSQSIVTACMTRRRIIISR